MVKLYMRKNEIFLILLIESQMAVIRGYSRLMLEVFGNEPELLHAKSVCFNTVRYLPNSKSITFAEKVRILDFYPKDTRVKILGNEGCGSCRTKTYLACSRSQAGCPASCSPPRVLLDMTPKIKMAKK